MEPWISKPKSVLLADYLEKDVLFLDKTPRTARHGLGMNSKAIIVLCFLGAFACQQAKAQNTFSPSPASSNWNNSNDWIGGIAPTSGSTLTFTNSSITALTNDFSGGVFTGITFAPGASAFTINGNAFTLSDGTGITNNSTASQIFNTAITLGSNTGIIQTFTTTGGGGNLALTGALSGSNGLTTIGAGTTVLSGTNTYAGPTAVDSGALEFGNQTAFYGGTTNLWTASNLTVSNGATAIFDVSPTNSKLFTSTQLSQISGLGTATTGFLSGSSIGIDLKGGTFGNGISFSNPNGGSNVLGLTVLGTGTNYVYGVNSYTGTTLLEGGTTTIDNAGVLPVGNTSISNVQMIVTNGAILNDNNGIIGNSSTSSNDSVLVTGTNASGAPSTWTNSTIFYVGKAGSSNLLTVSSGGFVSSVGTEIGVSNTASNNSIQVSGTGSVLSDFGNSNTVGYNGSGNSLVVSNGGTVAGGYTTIGYGANSSNNSVLVTGTGSLITNNAAIQYVGDPTPVSSGAVYVGYYGSSNSLLISNGGTVDAAGEILGVESNSSNNSILITGSDSTMSNGVQGLIVGQYGSGNSLVISNGGASLQGGGGSFQMVIGSPYGAPFGQGYTSEIVNSNNLVTVTGSGSLLSNAANGNGLIIGAGSHNNSLIVAKGGTVDAGVALYIGDGFYGTVNGTNFDGYSNSVTVTGSGSTLNANGGLLVGYNAGNGNSLIISNGGSVNVMSNNSGNAVNVSVINGSSLSSNDSVLVTGAGSLFTNSVPLDVYGTLTVANGATAAATSITLGGGYAPAIINIGSYGGNDTAGSLVSPSITFGNTGGSLNFNQVGNTAVTNPLLSGQNYNALVNQFGSGTTILSGSNTYYGTTTIQNGTLVAASTNAFGHSTVILNGGTLSFTTNASISVLTWTNPAGTIALPNLNKGAYLNTLFLTLDGRYVYNFNLAGDTLSSTPIEFLSWGTTYSTFTTNNFAAIGLNGYNYSISINNSALWISGVAVPEPSAWALILLGVLTLVIAGRRRVLNFDSRSDFTL